MDATPTTTTRRPPTQRRRPHARRAVATAVAGALACTLLLSGCDLFQKKTHAPGPDPTPSQSQSQ